MTVVDVMSRASAFVKLIRPINCLMMGGAVIVGAALAGKSTFVQQLSNLLMGFSTGFFLTGAAMTINDYYDREIDAINEPKRPIPSGEVELHEAKVFAFALAIIGLLSSSATGSLPNLQCLIIASFSLIIVILYVTRGKSTGLLGNFLVSICIATPIVYGGFVAGKGLQPTTSFFVAIIFLANTGREVTKGILDIQGDKENNIKTVAVLYGERKAAIVATLFYVSAVSLTPLPWLFGIVSVWFLPFVFFTDMGLILSSLLLLLSPTKENAKRIKNRNLFWFFSGLLAFIVGVIG